MAAKISVVVPVYRVEQYVKRCCDSILDQVYQDFEIVFVIDGSTDLSERILLDALASRAPVPQNVVVIRHEVNRGISAARETGLAAATGDYVLYVDSDDFIAPDMLEQLMSKAVDVDADIVFCDFYEVRAGKSNYVSQRFDRDSPEQLAAAMLREELVWCPWNKLFRRSLAVDHDIHWPIGINVGEDLVVITKLYLHAKRVAHVPLPLYYYNRDNVYSYINVWKPASVDQNARAVAEIAGFVEGRASSPPLLDAVGSLKLMARYQMLFTFDRAQADRAAVTFVETDSRLFRYVRTPLYWRFALYLMVKRHKRVARLLIRAIAGMRQSRALLNR